MEFNYNATEVSLNNDSDLDMSEDGDNIEAKLITNNLGIKNQYLLGRIAAFPCIDINGEYLVSINENGKGILNTIKYNTKIGTKLGKNTKKLPTGNDSSLNPIQFAEVKKFKISNETIDSAMAVFTIEIQQDHDIFIVGQISG